MIVLNFGCSKDLRISKGCLSWSYMKYFSFLVLSQFNPLELSIIQDTCIIEIEIEVLKFLHDGL